jgi:solute carrier family 50 protein (sugar transporter)
MGIILDVFPIIGVLFSNVLFFAPLPGVAAVARAGSLGAFNVVPQAVMVLSTTVWVMYGLSLPNLYIFVANAPGCIASVGYYVALLPLVPPSMAETRRSMQTIVVAGAAFTVGMWGVLVFSGCSAAIRSFYLGLYGSILCVILFASPLSTVALVVATSDSSSIYTPLMLAQVQAALARRTYLAPTYTHRSCSRRHQPHLPATHL